MRAGTAIHLITTKYDGYTANDYGEPGYSKGGDLEILFADWNQVPKRVYDRLESMGFSLEWSDEWIVDYDENKAYRQSPDCYHWTPYYWIRDDCEIIGGESTEDPDCTAQIEYVEYLTDNPKAANVFNIDFTKHGFRKLDKQFENGLHPGQDDQPSDIYAGLKGKYHVLFDITSKGQFDLQFTAWIKERKNEN